MHTIPTWSEGRQVWVASEFKQNHFLFPRSKESRRTLVWFLSFFFKASGPHSATWQNTDFKSFLQLQPKWKILKSWFGQAAERNHIIFMGLRGRPLSIQESNGKRKPLHWLKLIASKWPGTKLSRSISATEKAIDFYPHLALPGPLHLTRHRLWVWLRTQHYFSPSWGLLSLHSETPFPDEDLGTIWVLLMNKGTTPKRCFQDAGLGGSGLEREAANRQPVRGWLWLVGLRSHCRWLGGIFYVWMVSFQLPDA